MKKLSFEIFEAAKIPTNKLDKLVGGGTPTQGGTWDAPGTLKCGDLLSFQYSSDTQDGETTTYHGSSNFKYVKCEV